MDVRERVEIGTIEQQALRSTCRPPSRCRRRLQWTGCAVALSFGASLAASALMPTSAPLLLNFETGIQEEEQEYILQQYLQQQKCGRSKAATIPVAAAAQATLPAARAPIAATAILRMRSQLRQRRVTVLTMPTLAAVAPPAAALAETGTLTAAAAAANVRTAPEKEAAAAETARPSSLVSPKLWFLSVGPDSFVSAAPLVSLMSPGELALSVYRPSSPTAAGAAALPSSRPDLKGPLQSHLACGIQRLKPQQKLLQQQQQLTAFIRPAFTGAASQKTAAPVSLAAAAAALEQTTTKVAALQAAADNSATTTAPSDRAAAAAAAAPALPFRIGHGYDMHRLSTDPKTITGPLILSGVSFAAEAAEAAAKAAAVANPQQAKATAAAAAAAAAAFSGGRRLLSAASSGLRRLLRFGMDTPSSSNSSSSSNNSSSSSNVAFGVVAHSDGDVVLHAAADAIFAASGAKDIGQQFPDTAAENKGRDSKDFVAAAAASAAAAGYTVAQLDVTLLLQRPRIGDKKQQMIENLAAALGIHRSQVSIKAKTGEGIGPVGRSEAVECHAVALLQRKG
ncbi:2C-methyl-D-erythritol 2,4-cyclodiphosphate synthase domain-containing protein, putative [Eimeria brunetti]|uniref:2-C-methyl-D-erythritol 2,4-cyclodiphosphate synthase n=1 Tax=Eimeria brunetti TaxID=51314 RepID=U6LJL2_9EIME|nr:2C-methyl-D-erythritol 2,4-cyclodiphosphate synthase domain-containing protein, putative [Eimeria brunetti]